MGVEQKTPANVVWSPMAGSQELALTCPCNHILYEGTRGPGKTDAQIMYFRRFVGMGYKQFWRGVIFDREYKNLDDLISKSRRWYPQFFDGAKFISSASHLKWVWKTGEELWFRVMKTESDYWSYHGHEFPFIGWNELTKQPTSDLYDMAMSLNRTSFLPEEHSPKGTLLPEIPLRVFSTSNPFGVGHNWVKRRFIDPAEAGEVIRTVTEVFNPRTLKREEVTKTQVRIFGSYKENRYLAPEYVAELENIKDENKRRAWLWGDWDITSGGMFDDVWSDQYNVVDEFAIPHSWRISRTFDWGSSAPFSVGWWAESDGSDYQGKDGKIYSTMNGDLFRINEWYGWDGNENKGLKMLASDIAKGIVERELAMGIRDRIEPGPADNSINDEVNGNCIANDMKQHVTIDGKRYIGPIFSKSNKSPGSRVNGWELMRNAIAGAHPSERGPRERAGLFCFRKCQDGFLRTVPTIARCSKNLDDVNTDAEDHVADESRYMVLSTGNRFVSGSLMGQY